MIFISYGKPKRLQGTREQRRLQYNRFGFPEIIGERIGSIRRIQFDRLRDAFNKTPKGKLLINESNAAAEQLEKISKKTGSIMQAFLQAGRETKMQIIKNIEINQKVMKAFLDFARNQKGTYKEPLKLAEEAIERVEKVLELFHSQL